MQLTALHICYITKKGGFYYENPQKQRKENLKKWG